MKKLFEHNPSAPHQAVIVLNVEIMENLSDGRVSGIPIEKFAKVYTVKGKNSQECKENLTKFMEKFNAKQDNK